MRLPSLFSSSPQDVQDVAAIKKQRQALWLNVAKSQAINCTDPACTKHAGFSHYLRYEAGVMSAPYDGPSDWKDPLVPCTTIMRLQAEAEQKRLAKKKGDTGARLRRFSKGSVSSASSSGSRIAAGLAGSSDAAGSARSPRTQPRSSTSSSIFTLSSIVTTSSSSGSASDSDSSSTPISSPRESPRATGSSMTLHLEPIKALLSRLVQRAAQPQAAGSSSPLAASNTPQRPQPLGPAKARRASAPSGTASLSSAGGALVSLRRTKSEDSLAGLLAGHGGGGSAGAALGLMGSHAGAVTLTITHDGNVSPASARATHGALAPLQEQAAGAWRSLKTAASSTMRWLSLKANRLGRRFGGRSAGGKHSSCLPI